MLENNGAADITLTDKDLLEIKMALSKLHARGERYPELHQKLIDR